MSTSPLQSLQKSAPKPYMAWPFYFGQKLNQTKRKGGVILQNYHTSNIRGGKVQNRPHHAVQWVKLPQNDIWHDIFGVASSQSSNSELNLNSNQNLDLNRKENKEKKKRKELGLH